MSEVPTPVSESTSPEIVRKEGTAQSAKAIGTISAGNILSMTTNSSGAYLAVGATSANVVFGVALEQATSGQRVTAIKGKVRAFWDGTGSPVFGSPIATSTTQSGMWEVSATTSGVAVIGYFFGTGAGSSLVAANSGTIQAVVIQ